MRTLTLEEYQAEGTAKGWRMLCPMCGNVATPADFEKAGEKRVLDSFVARP